MYVYYRPKCCMHMYCVFIYTYVYILYIKSCMHMYCMLLCTACLCTLCIYSSCIWTISLHTICICNRKQRRPQYKKHRSQRRSGWIHLECSTCNQLRRDIKKENNNNKFILNTVMLQAMMQKGIQVWNMVKDRNGFIEYSTPAVLFVMFL